MTENKLIQLCKIPKGSRVLIMEVPEGKRKSQLIRLGLSKGEFIRCLERLPGGTMVIQKNRREIAIGSTLAKGILVKHSDSETSEEKSRKNRSHAS
jgi:Fe2+ transport system protein FeoA